jgi:hypothetical protein
MEYINGLFIKLFLLFSLTLVQLLLTKFGACPDIFVIGDIAIAIIIDI